MCQRTLLKTHHFILAKLLKFQETFPEKFLVSGFGAEAPTDNAHKKHGNAVLFYLSSIVGTAFQTSLSYLSYNKGKPKNFPPNTSLYFSKVFEFPKDFFQKVLWSGFGAEAPTLNADIKKHGDAVLFYSPNNDKNCSLKMT